jgi:exopolysaccharide production protein ExoQ
MRISRKKFTERAEKSFIVISLILLMGGIVRHLLGGEDGRFITAAESLTLQYIYATIYVIIALLLVRQKKRAVKTIFAEKILLTLVIFAVFSLSWSILPLETLKRVIALTGTFLFGYYLAIRFNTEDIFRIIGYTFITVMLLSLVWILVVPSYGMHVNDTHHGAWRGIFAHKNIFGSYMVLCAILCLFFYRIQHNAIKIFFILLFFISIIAILFSRSATAVAGIGFILVMVIILRYVSIRQPHARIVAIYIAFTITVIVSLLVINNYQALFGLLGRSETLTGRIPLWYMTAESIAERPVFGYGYGAYWLGLEGPSARIWNSLHWNPSHAHNGFVDLAFQLGLVGLSIFLISYIYIAVVATRWMYHYRGVLKYWPITYLLYFLSVNLTESNIMTVNDELWIIYIAVGITLIKSYGIMQPFTSR